MSPHSPLRHPIARRSFLFGSAAVFAAFATRGAPADSLTLLGIGGAGGGFNVFVDSVGGNDSNSGLSPSQAVQTLAKAISIATPIGAGVGIGMKAGSTWREQFEMLSLANIEVGTYGAGDAPKILADDSLSSGGWTKTSGQTNVYQRSYTPFSGYSSGNDYLNVYENDVPLTEESSIATCDAAAGSRFIDDVGNIIYINASTTDKNPATNGNTYDFTAREFALHLDSGGCSVSGIYARRAARNDGSIVLDGKGCLIAGCEVRDGSKHNVLIGSGTVSGCTVQNAYFGSGNTNLIVGFLADASGESITVSGCTLGIDTASSLVSGVYHHANANSYDSATVSSNTFTNLGSAYSGDNVSAQTVSGNATTNCISGVLTSGAAPMTISNHTDTNAQTGTVGPWLNVGGTGKVTITGGTVCRSVQGSEVIHPTVSGWDMDISSLTVGADVGASFSVIQADPGGTLKLRNCVFDTTNIGYGLILGRTSATTLDSDFNAWRPDTKFEIDGTTYNTFAAYQSATGEDQHSTTNAQAC